MCALTSDTCSIVPHSQDYTASNAAPAAPAAATAA